MYSLQLPPPSLHQHSPALHPPLAGLEVEIEIRTSDLSRTFQASITETPRVPLLRLEARLDHQRSYSYSIIKALID